MPYKMIAERDNEKVNCERESGLLLAAKARIFSSEGWKVLLLDREGKSYDVEEFAKLFREWTGPAPETMAALKAS